MATDKRITSDDFLDRLKLIFSNLPDAIFSLDIQLRPGLAAVLHISRYVTDSDKPDKITYGATGASVEQTLAVYNVNDFDDVMHQNEELRDVLGKIVYAYDGNELDVDELITEARVLMVEK